MWRKFYLLGVLVIWCVACERVTEKPTGERQEPLAPPAATAPTTSAAPSSPQGGQVAAAVIAIHSGERVHNMTVEIAMTDEEREKGLKGRESLPANGGMWFIFPEEVDARFWMKDTLVSLDLIFVNNAKVIVDIAPNAVPLSETLIGSQVPFRYVLEVNAGFAEANGVEVGDTIEVRLGPAE